MAAVMLLLIIALFMAGLIFKLHEKIKEFLNPNVKIQLPPLIYVKDEEVSTYDPLTGAIFEPGNFVFGSKIKLNIPKPERFVFENNRISKIDNDLFFRTQSHRNDGPWEIDINGHETYSYTHNDVRICVSISSNGSIVLKRTTAEGAFEHRFEGFVPSTPIMGQLTGRVVGSVVQRERFW